MTAVRPERAGGQPSYEDTGEFVNAVSQLTDPLSDPLPGRAPAPSADPAGPECAAGHQQPAYEEPAYEEPAYNARYARSYPPAPPEYQTPVYEPAAAAPQPQQPPSAEPETARTAALPVIEVEEAAAGWAARRRAAQTSAVAEANAAEELDGTAPVPGGRAARRQAAKHGGRRARTAPAASHTASGADAAHPPMSRVEARRAARAAKESPAVVISRAVGELFISLGVLMLLFVAYQLWWTNVLADEASSGEANNLQHQWAQSDQRDQRNPGSFSPGQGFAIIYIPKLDVKAPIAEGVDEQTILNKGLVGHYSGAMETAMPWDKTGNFALAGHRNTHGEPFRYINKLVPGDKVVVETSSTYYTYQVTSMLPQTSPSNVAVIDPIPVGSGFTKPGQYITLTTCTPEFTSTYRLIVWGKMVAEQPRTKGLPPALSQG